MGKLNPKNGNKNSSAIQGYSNLFIQISKHTVFLLVTFFLFLVLFPICKNKLKILSGQVCVLHSHLFLGKISQHFQNGHAWHGEMKRDAAAADADHSMIPFIIRYDTSQVSSSDSYLPGNQKERVNNSWMLNIPNIPGQK